MEHDLERTWLAEFAVETLLAIPEGCPRLEFLHPSKELKAFLEPPYEETSDYNMILRVVYRAKDVDVAVASAAEIVSELINLISFATQLPFRIKRKRFLIDWSTGQESREARLYFYEPKRQVVGDIERSFLSTIEALIDGGFSRSTNRAVHWYAAGVRANLMEDQFQYFWFAIELIAASEQAKRVSDKCAICQTELFCSNCNGPSQHKPYQSQKIRALLTDLGLPTDVFAGLEGARHKLMHGATREELEAYARDVDAKGGFSVIVDAAGEAAWRAIQSTFGLEDGARMKLHFGQTDTYVPVSRSIALDMILTLPGDADQPNLDQLRMPKVEASVIERFDDGEERTISF